MKVWIDRNNFENLKNKRFTFPITLTLLEPPKASRYRFIELSSIEEIKLEENQEIARLKEELNKEKAIVKRYENLLRKALDKFKDDKKKRASY